ncbi:MAG: inner membrane CreD family protein [Lentisphaeria bacterium]|nr:inner membrane CreD family protein [Lentisphaeria bacterium]
MSEEKSVNWIEKFNGNTKSLGVKIAVIIAALLVFQIPLLMVKELAEERQGKAKSVQSEIFSNWGGVQCLTLHPQAEKMDLSAELNPEIRYRGIYQALVYTAEVKLKAEFNDVSENKFAELLISDIDRVADAAAVVNGKAVKIEKDGYTLKFPLEKGKSAIEMTLNLRGGGDFKVTPNTHESCISISGKWGSPSFIGKSLPDSRIIQKDSFSAKWNFGNFTAKPNEIGVNLNLPANTYQQVERCFNYATLFLIIFFATLLVAEAVTKVNIHILQYLIAAGAPVLFYLMTLAFGERIGFTAGYIVSAAVIILMVTMYAKAFIGKIRPALAMGTIFAVSYAVNFILLRMEDLALLSGTIILALVLAILMALTGKMNRQQ